MVRYVKDKTIREESLFCKPLQTTTTTIASDIFNLVKDFFIEHYLHLSLIDSICTDEASAMLGNCSGFAALLKEVPTLKVTTCMIHSQALASKSMPKT